MELTGHPFRQTCGVRHDVATHIEKIRRLVELGLKAKSKTSFADYPLGKAFARGRAWLRCPMQASIWIGIFIGSTIGGLIPELWGGDMISYSGVLLSGVGAFVGLWLGSRASR